jgi:PadR family transcriptional regulator, regulatory protein PadR
MKAEVLKGHLDGLLLAVLEAGPAHGYAVIETLRSNSSGQFDLPTGTVYPALHRLERSGWSVVGGRRRRTYELTGAGHRALAGERSRWSEFAAAMSTVLGQQTNPVTS